MRTATIGNLWGALLGANAGSACSGNRDTQPQPAYQAKITDMARPGTKTLELLSALAHSPASTNSLAETTSLTQRKVWGLLKQPRDKGMVTYSPDSGIWQLNREYEGPAIDRARSLLESKGWVCVPPRAGA